MHEEENGQTPVKPSALGFVPEEIHAHYGTEASAQQSDEEEEELRDAPLSVSRPVFIQTEQDKGEQIDKDQSEHQAVEGEGHGHTPSRTAVLTRYSS